MRAGNRRFTLVEMMIVVAIIMLLAAIAIPALNSAQLKAKRREISLNVDGIVKAEVAYHAANDVYLSVATLWPTGTYGKTARPWTTGSAFDGLGWAPDGAVRGVYIVSLSPDPLAQGSCDIDGDLVNNSGCQDTLGANCGYTILDGGLGWRWSLDRY